MMGMQTLREELEDHAFRWLHPEAYDALTEKLAEMRERNRGLVEEIRQAIARKCLDSRHQGRDVRERKEALCHLEQDEA